MSKTDRVIDLRTVKSSPTQERSYKDGYAEGYKQGMRAALACFRSSRSDTIASMFEEFWRTKLRPWSDKGYFANPPRVRCAACGRTSLLEIDHIVPKSVGGESRLNNYQFLCRHCNAAKSNNE